MPKKPAHAFGLFLLFAAPLVAFWWTHDQGVSWLAFVVALSFTVLTNIDDLAEFSVGPLKAKMRESIVEATATATQLRQLGITVGRALLADMMAGSFIGGMTTARRLSFHDELMSAIDALNPSPEQRDQVELEWRKGIHWIYLRAIRKVIQFPSGEVERRWNALGDFETWAAPTPRRIERFLSEEKMEATPEARAWIDDYRHFSETGEIRRRDTFAEQ
ncbi:MAG TPA: hypothetical protein VG942_03005 [Hyphomonadaceae bacterium]|nr:hypothetical protein [Hyphomonadaceae bacterium]HVZ13688.1 hypothetical protein [Bauldia sp.]